MRVGFRVRVAEAGDLAGVVALERMIAEASHWGEAEYAAMVGSATACNAVRRCFFVAEADGGLLGFAVGKVIGSDGEAVGELESVVVEASARRGGIGNALCGAVADWCRASRVAKGTCSTSVGPAGCGHRPVIPPS